MTFPIYKATPVETASPFAGHTPGPWEICGTTLTNRDFPTKHPHFEIGAANSIAWIAHVLCFSDKNIGSEYEANARLIAAAPDLLKKNVELESQLTQVREELEVMRDSVIDQSCTSNDLRGKLGKAEAENQSHQGKIARQRSDLARCYQEIASLKVHLAFHHGGEAENKRLHTESQEVKAYLVNAVRGQ